MQLLCCSDLLKHMHPMCCKYSDFMTIHSAVNLAGAPPRTILHIPLCSILFPLSPIIFPLRPYLDTTFEGAPHLIYIYIYISNYIPVKYHRNTINILLIYHLTSPCNALIIPLNDHFFKSGWLISHYNAIKPVIILLECGAPQL